MSDLSEESVSGGVRGHGRPTASRARHDATREPAEEDRWTSAPPTVRFPGGGFGKVGKAGYPSASASQNCTVVAQSLDTQGEADAATTSKLFATQIFGVKVNTVIKNRPLDEAFQQWELGDDHPGPGRIPGEGKHRHKKPRKRGPRIEAKDYRRSREGGKRNRLSARQLAALRAKQLETVEPNPGPPRFTFSIDRYECGHALAAALHEEIHVQRLRWVTVALVTVRVGNRLLAHTELREHVEPDPASEHRVAMRVPSSTEAHQQAVRILHGLQRRPTSEKDELSLGGGIEPNPGPPVEPAAVCGGGATCLSASHLHRVKRPDGATGAKSAPLQGFARRKAEDAQKSPGSKRYELVEMPVSKCPQCLAGVQHYHGAASVKEGKAIVSHTAIGAAMEELTQGGVTALAPATNAESLLAKDSSTRRILRRARTVCRGGSDDEVQCTTKPNTGRFLNGKRQHSNSCIFLSLSHALRDLGVSVTPVELVRRAKWPYVDRVFDGANKIHVGCVERILHLYGLTVWLLNAKRVGKGRVAVGNGGMPIGDGAAIVFVANFDNHFEYITHVEGRRTIIDHQTTAAALGRLVFGAISEEEAVIESTDMSGEAAVAHVAKVHAKPLEAKPAIGTTGATKAKSAEETPLPPLSDGAFGPSAGCPDASEQPPATSSASNSSSTGTKSGAAVATSAASALKPVPASGAAKPQSAFAAAAPPGGSDGPIGPTHEAGADPGPESPGSPPGPTAKSTLYTDDTRERSLVTIYYAGQAPYATWPIACGLAAAGIGAAALVLGGAVPRHRRPPIRERIALGDRPYDPTRHSITLAGIGAAGYAIGRTVFARSMRSRGVHTAANDDLALLTDMVHSQDNHGYRDHQAREHWLWPMLGYHNCETRAVYHRVVDRILSHSDIVAMDALRSDYTFVEHVPTRIAQTLAQVYGDITWPDAEIYMHTMEHIHNQMIIRTVRRLRSTQGDAAGISSFHSGPTARSGQSGGASTARTLFSASSRRDLCVTGLLAASVAVGTFAAAKWYSRAPARPSLTERIGRSLDLPPLITESLTASATTARNWLSEGLRPVAKTQQPAWLRYVMTENY